jgi:hypothetical protein
MATMVAKCVVGEAHGFSSSYTPGCHECGRIDSIFAFNFTTHSYQKLHKYKHRCVMHWHEKHRMNKIGHDFKKTTIG